MFVGVFLLLLLMLFFSTQYMTRGLSRLFHHMTGSQGVAVRMLSFLFLPGIILHEVSHALMAFLLFVPVGKMEFLPVVDGDHVKMGSVQIGKADPLRRFLIGIAPVIVGLVLLFGLLSLLLPSQLSFALLTDWRIYVLSYAVFQISNTMFSSRKDMEGAVELFLVLIALFLILYLLGVRVPEQVAVFFISGAGRDFFRQASMVLLVPVGLNMVLLGCIKLLGRG